MKRNLPFPELKFVIALCLLALSVEGVYGMTNNLPWAYKKSIKLGRAIPSYSRVRSDMIFRKGDKIEFFTFPKLRPIACRWEITKNALKKPFESGNGEICMDQSVKVTVPAKRLTPGFYDVYVTIHASAKRKEKARVSFGYRIDELAVTDSRPADFDEFWAKALAELTKIPLNAAEQAIREMNDEEISQYNLEHACLPEHYDPDGEKFRKVKVYKVQFDSAGGRRIYAWLTVPVGKGPFPGLLLLPGAGCGRLPAPVEHARHGYVTLDIHIHGMDVDQAKYKSPPGYMSYRNSGVVKDQYYYNVYLSCAQAIRYLSQRPEVDASRIAVAGASQGGQLSIVTAGLCPNVKAVVSELTYYSYWPFRDQVTELNNKKSDGSDTGAPPFDRKNARQNCMSYLDPMNFAPNIKGATIMCACLCDHPSPITTVYAVYNNLGNISKELQLSPTTSHDLIFSFERKAWRWLDKKLKVTETK